MENKVSRPRFFQKTFLMTNTKYEMILVMLLVKISNTDMSFGEKTLMQKSYITNKLLLTFKHVQIVNLKKFVIAVLDANNKMFVVHMASRK